VPGWPLLCLLAAFALSAAAQGALRAGAASAGLAALGGALLAGWLSARLAPREPRPPPPPVLPARELRPRAVPAAIGVLCLAGVLGLQAADREYGLQLAAWLLSVLAWTVAWAPRERFGPTGRRRAREAALVLALVAIGLGARLAALGHVPGGFYGDEAEFGLRALGLLEGRLVPPFSVVFDQHPTLYHWVQAGGMALAGRDVFGVRFSSALAGGATTLPLYLLLRRDLGVAGAAAGALLLAFSPLHVHLTRIASNNAWVGLWTTAAMAALYAAVRSGRPAPAAAAGVSFGLCFLFGNKAIGLPPAMAAALAALAASGALPVWRQWRLGVLALAAALLVFLPEAVHYLRHDWYGPLLAHPMRKLVELPASGSAAGALGDQLRRALLAFVYLPDRSPFAPFGGFTLVTAAEGALATVGTARCLGRPSRPLAAFLLGWLVVGVATNALDRAAPQAHHQIGVSMLPAALAALALHDLGRALARLAARPWLAPAVCVPLAALAAGQGARAYFVVGRGHWAGAETTAIARAMSEYGPDHHLVLVTRPMSWQLNSTFKYLARGVPVGEGLVSLDPARPWLDPPDRDVAFIVGASKQALLPTLRRRYPDGELRERRGPAGELLASVYLVPGEEVARTESSLSASGGRPGSR
jgi:4-amino-4-deoxy-L-arabinose transferase-like glycosyltransferase